MSKVSNPYDLLFKAVFGQPDEAEDFARHYLPPSIWNTFAPGTFRLRKDSFVDEALRENFSDLLYQVDFKAGHNGFVCILFEHKSYPQKDVAFQLFRYLTRVLIESREEATGLLSPVLPVVVYHGAEKWNVPLNFAALYAGPEFLRKDLLDFSYHLCDLSSYHDTEIRGGAIVAATLLLLKHSRSADLPDRLPGFFKLLRAANEQSTLAFLRTALQYIGMVTNKVTKDHFRAAVKAALPHTGAIPMNKLIEDFVDEFMAAREPELIRRGREQGILQGIEQGMMEGRRREASSLTIRLLTRKLGGLDDPTRDRVGQLSLEELEALGEALLDFTGSADMEQWLDALPKRSAPPQPGADTEASLE
ncbi:MAG: Rpn family recombination-promoting nuclease/putative transposase [Thermodesulfobacteriota bacterium]